MNPLEERLQGESQRAHLLRRGNLLLLNQLRRLEPGVLVKILGRDDHVPKVLLHQKPADPLAVFGRVKRQLTHHARRLGLRVLNLHSLAVLGVVDHHLLTVRGRLALQRSLQFAHLARFTVNQHHVRRSQRVQKLLRLRIVRVRAERYGVHGHPQRKLLTCSARHRLAVAENLTSQSTLHGEVAYDDAVL